MSDAAPLEAGLALDLDTIAERAGGALTRGKLRDGFRREQVERVLLDRSIHQGSVHAHAVFDAPRPLRRKPGQAVCQHQPDTSPTDSHGNKPFAHPGAERPRGPAKAVEHYLILPDHGLCKRTVDVNVDADGSRWADPGHGKGGT